MRKCIESAIDLGYRHIDTALLYQTEKMVGQAVRNKIKDGTVKREDLFITSKVCGVTYMFHVLPRITICGGLCAVRGSIRVIMESDNFVFAVWFNIQ